MTNIISQLIATQTAQVKDTLGESVLYNGNTITALSIRTMGEQESTEMGQVIYKEIEILVDKNDVSDVALNSDVVVVGGVDYVAADYEDETTFWTVRCRASITNERSTPEYRRNNK